MTTGGSDRDRIQERIDQARARVLGGRGPGASQDEIARWTRDRPTLGDRPSADALERLAAQTRLARGEPHEIVQVVREDRAEVSATVAALAGRVRRRPVVRATARAVPACALVLLAAVVCRSLIRCRGRGSG